MSWLDALLGKIRNSGTDVPLSGGLNFKSGLQAVLNAVTGVIDVSPDVPNMASVELSAALAPRLRGVGLTVDASSKLALRLRPRDAQLQDYFISGNTTSGSIGALGWNLLGVGTPTYVRGSAASMGSSARGEITTSAAANDRSVLCLGTTETQDILAPQDVRIMQAIVNQDSNTVSKRFFFGLMGTFATEPSTAVDGLGIYYDSAVSPNYLIISRASSVGSPVNTGVAVPSATQELITIYCPVVGTYQFYLGSILIGTISSGVANAQAMNVGFRVEALTTAAKHTNVGYFGMQAIAANAFDDDTFLEA